MRRPEKGFPMHEVAIHWPEYSRFLVMLAAVLDPIGAIPIFLVLTKTYTESERRRTARITALAVWILLSVTALTGETLLTWMGTSFAAFRVGGGIVLLLMGISMLGAELGPLRTTPQETNEAATKESIAMVPLGIPLLAGPGALSAVIVQMDRGTGWLHAVIVLACVAIVAGLCWLALRFAEPLGRALGPIGLNVAHRLIGLILTAIAIEMMANGMKQLFPALG